jgi:glycosyltransferase involved in cell wall biosynthesis
MIRVLHVHSGNLFGGVERMMQVLSPAIAGCAPVHSSFALCFEGPVANTLRAANADVHILGAVRARRPDEVRGARNRLREVLLDVQPHVAIVHSAWSQAIFGRTVLSSDIPLVRWLHAPQPGPVWVEAWASRSQPALVLCNSRYTLENVRGRFGTAPMVVQYPPCTMKPSAPDARHAVRAGIGAREDAVVVMMAARLESGKGHGRLLEALAAVRETTWEAWIVGGVQQPAEQSYLDDLRSLAASLGIQARVRFLGQRSNMADLLAAADIYCQPNVAPDSFGLSFVEALAAGLPVITTRLGGATEIVDETCGVLVGPGSPQAVTCALARLIAVDGDRAALAAAARVRAANFCSVPLALAELSAHLAFVMPRTLALR